MPFGDRGVVPAAVVKNDDVSTIDVTHYWDGTFADDHPTRGLQKRARTEPFGAPTRAFRGTA